jgi:hypothetical protein
MQSERRKEHKGIVPAEVHEGAQTGNWGGLEAGVSVAEVAPPLEVSPNCCSASGRNFAQRRGDEALHVERMCALAGMNRASFYRFPSGASAHADADMYLRDPNQCMALDFPGDG